MTFRKLIDEYAVSVAVYGIVAGISAITEWTTFFGMIDVLNPFTAAICAFFVATVVNYVLSRAIAFNSRRAVREELILVFMFSAVAFIFNFVVFVILYTIVGLDPMIAKVNGTCIGFVLNYGFRQFIVFSPASRFAAFSGLVSGAVDPSTSKQSDITSYTGHRILKAMRSAPRYANEIYFQLRSAIPPKVGPILDFGAGDGLFAEKFLIDGTAVCVEPDLTNQAILRGLGLKVAGSIGELGNNRYCLAYSINVLEHLEQLEWYLGELNRVLRPGGTAYHYRSRRAGQAELTELVAQLSHQ
jgi:putative flippase GtrA